MFYMFSFGGQFKFGLIGQNYHNNLSAYFNSADLRERETSASLAPDQRETPPTPLDSLGPALCCQTVILPVEERLSNEQLSELSVEKYPTFQLTKPCHRTSGVFDMSFKKC